MLSSHFSSVSFELGTLASLIVVSFELGTLASLIVAPFQLGTLASSTTTFLEL
jgi:hypothetical protein